MASFTSLLPLLLSATTPSALAMAVDCAPTPPSPHGPVPWVRSWMPPVLHHQLSGLFPHNDMHRAHQSTALDSRHEQPLEAMEEGEDPAFCPL